MQVISETVGLFHAKTHLSELLERVSKGESIAITKHGRRVAIMVPAEGKSKRSAKKIAEEYFAMTRGVKLKGLSIREMINEGRTQ
ncbi:hypothetical protein BH09VER1_BH09VER1_52820 [soil metagenome]